MKRSFQENNWRTSTSFMALCRAIQKCKTDKELANFLRDIGTLSELQAWSERLEVATEVQKGTPYREIAKKTGASTTTVTRVAYYLENGEGGYKTALNTKHHHPLVSRRERMVPMVRK